MDGGADLILIETIFDTLNAKAAIFACEETFAKRGAAAADPDLRHDHRPFRAHACPARRRPRSGIPCATRSPLTIGLNCALGAAAMREHLEEIAGVADTLTCAYPNAGLPNAFGQYDESPEEMAAQIREFAVAGLVNVVGGCCGSTPAHIHAIAEAVRGVHAARRSPRSRRSMRLAGLEPFALTSDIPFVNVGERTNVTGSAKFRKLITAGDYAGALSVARDQVANGAQILDVNMDEGISIPEPRWSSFSISSPRSRISPACR